MKLPKDILFEICKELPIKNLKILSLVSSNYAKICTTESLWLHLIKRDFPFITISPQHSYLETYKELLMPKIILATAGDCYFCTRQPLLDSVKQLESVYKIDIIHSKTMSDIQLPATYPPQIKSYIAWFPIIMIFTHASWIEGTHLVGSIFNGNFNENGPPGYSYPSEVKVFNFENVDAWIKQFKQKNILS